MCIQIENQRVICKVAYPWMLFMVSHTLWNLRLVSFFVLTPTLDHFLFSSLRTNPFSFEVHPLGYTSFFPSLPHEIMCHPSQNFWIQDSIPDSYDFLSTQTLGLNLSPFQINTENTVNIFNFLMQWPCPTISATYSLSPYGDSLSYTLKFFIIETLSSHKSLIKIPNSDLLFPAYLLKWEPLAFYLVSIHTLLHSLPTLSNRCHH